MGTRLLVAFDVDDTLIVPAVATGFDRDVPSYETIAVYRWFQAQGHEMVIWSGGGADYARQWADKLGLTADWYLDKHAATAAVGCGHAHHGHPDCESCVWSKARWELRRRAKETLGIPWSPGQW